MEEKRYPTVEEESSGGKVSEPIAAPVRADLHDASAREPGTSSERVKLLRSATGTDSGLRRDQGDRSLICSPKIRIRKRKSSRGFRFLFVYVLRLRYACGATHSCEPRMFPLKIHKPSQIYAQALEEDYDHEQE